MNRLFFSRRRTPDFILGNDSCLLVFFSIDTFEKVLAELLVTVLVKPHGDSALLLRFGVFVFLVQVQSSVVGLVDREDSVSLFGSPFGVL